MVTIYLDVLFLINFTMDLILLWSTAKVIRTKTSLRRLLTGAFIGSIWVCFITLVTVPDWISNTASFLIINSFMVFLSYRPESLKQFLKAFLALYIMAFVLGGLLNVIYYHTGAGAMLRNWLMNGESLPMSLKIMILITGLALILFYFGWKWYQTFGKQEKILKMILTRNGVSISLNGLYDTGNCLYEPITKSPVHIAEYEAVNELLSETERTMIGDFLKGQNSEAAKESIIPGFYLVPFRSVGKESGLLPAVRMDLLVTNEETHIEWCKPLIGFLTHQLDGQKRYQIIIHPGEER